MDKIPMTPSGHVALSEEYRRRTSEDRPAIIAAISEARAHGDLSENAEYHAAKEQQSLNEGRIQELEDLLRRATVIESVHGETVALGSQVKVEEVGEGPEEFRIVGSAEADPLGGQISNASPLGAALMGRRAGDVVTYKAPNGATMTFKLLEVR